MSTGATLRLGGNTAKNQGSATVNPVMSATLIDMGFSKYKSNKALQMVNNLSIDAAIQYIYDHFNELDQEETEFSNHQETNPSSTAMDTTTHHETTHSVVDHPQQPPTTTSPSLGGSIPIIHTNPNKLKGDSIENKLAFAERERLREMERIKKEKLEEKKRVKALKEQMKKEKEEKMMKQGAGSSSSSSASSATTTSASSSSGSSGPVSSSALIQARLPTGSTEKVTLADCNENTNLKDLFNALAPKLDRSETYSILTPFPRKEYFENEWDSVTLQQAGLMPKGSVILQLTKNKGVVIKASSASSHTMTDDGDNDDNDDDDDNGPYVPPTMPAVMGGGRVLGGSSSREPAVEEPYVSSILKKGPTDTTRLNMLLCEKQWIISKVETSETGNDLMVYRHLGDSHLAGQSLSLAESILFSAHGHVSMSANGETMVGTWRWINNSTTIEISYQNAVQTMLVDSLTDECMIVKRK